MADIVFVLGAGTSHNAGAPLMPEFLDRAYELHWSGKVPDESANFEEVFEAIRSLQQVHSKCYLDITNVESVFAAFEMAKTLGSFPGSQADPDSRIVALKTLIRRTLEESIRLTFDGKKECYLPTTLSSWWISSNICELQSDQACLLP